MQIFTKSGSTLTALSVHCRYTALELCVCAFEVDNFSLMTVEGTYEFVGKNKTQVVYFVFIAGDEEHN